MSADWWFNRDHHYSYKCHYRATTGIHLNSTSIAAVQPHFPNSISCSRRRSDDQNPCVGGVNRRRYVISVHGAYLVLVTRAKCRTYFCISCITAFLKTGTLLTEWFPLPTITRSFVASCSNMSRKAFCSLDRASRTRRPCRSISRVFVFKLCAM
jgi:hypothetical protein